MAVGVGWLLDETTVTDMVGDRVADAVAGTFVVPDVGAVDAVAAVVGFNATPALCEVLTG